MLVRFKVSRSCLAVLAIVGWAAVSGCDAGGGLIPAKGKLTVDGKPAEGASILFHPESAGAAKVSAAAVEADGTYAVSTDGELGIPAGIYKLSITWPDPNVKLTEHQKMFSNIEPGPDLLKGKYLTKEKANLQIEVKRGMNELAPIDLKTK